MVNPLLFIAILLGTGFVFSWVRSHFSKTAWILYYAALFSSLAGASYWLFHLLNGGQAPGLLPGGFDLPAGIVMRWGVKEAFLSTAFLLTGTLGAMAFQREWNREQNASPVLYLVGMVAALGLVMSGDLFNIFVFIEISTIASAGIMVSGRQKNAWAAGFKLLLATGLASVLLLIGTIFLYRNTGSLAIDVMATRMGPESFVPVFLVIAAILIKLKLWPAGGYGIDVYTASHPVGAAMISTIQSGAMVYVFYKLIPLMPAGMLPVLLWAGALTFVLAHLAGLRQQAFQRMLAYSSVGMMGLFVTAIIALYQHYSGSIPGDILLTVLGGFFITHTLAKAGLFWLVSHYTEEDGTFDIKSLGSAVFGTVVVSALIAALAGLPPFPSFWSKWTLVRILAQTDITILSTILLGVLFEAINLFRWLGRALEGESHCAVHAPPVISALAVAGLLLPLAFYLPAQFNPIILLSLVILLIGGLIIRLPQIVQTIVSMAILAAVGWFVLPLTEGVLWGFTAMILGIGFLMLIRGFGKASEKRADMPLIVSMTAAVALLGAARSALDFWTGWELMTGLSALLILRGRHAAKAAVQYWSFSMAGAYMLLAGLALAMLNAASPALADVMKAASPASIILMSLGFLFKAGAFGVHIWIPGAYAESEDEATPFISALVSKAPVLGVLLIVMHAQSFEILHVNWYTVLSWVGVLTALYGALMATFQEDVKKLLAYSSMGQVGYIIAAIALANYSGWVTAIYLTINHVLYKGLLFLTIAGVIEKVKTRQMYEMGGLIKRMPLSFVAVLMSIIAISGVPPLTGFGGKWMMYSSFIEAGWTLQAGMAFFASAVAFLYLYRLIHTVFLGMPKNEHLDVKESSITRLIPMFVLIAAIMGISTMPKLLLEPVMNWVGTQYTATMHWDGNSLVSSLGNWNGNAIMMATMGVFMLPLFFLLLRVRHVQKVKPFNIVFAGEKPERPETTHVAYNFFAHYRRALGFIVEPRATRFWDGVIEYTDTLGDWVRQWTTGNGQTYLIQIMLFVSVLYFAVRQMAF